MDQQQAPAAAAAAAAVTAEQQAAAGIRTQMIREELVKHTLPQLKKLATIKGIKTTGVGWMTCCPPSGRAHTSTEVTKEDILTALCQPAGFVHPSTLMRELYTVEYPTPRDRANDVAKLWEMQRLAIQFRPPQWETNGLIIPPGTSVMAEFEKIKQQQQHLAAVAAEQQADEQEQQQHLAAVAAEQQADEQEEQQLLAAVAAEQQADEREEQQQHFAAVAAELEQQVAAAELEQQQDAHRVRTPPHPAHYLSIYPPVIHIY